MADLRDYGHAFYDPTLIGFTAMQGQAMRLDSPANGLPINSATKTADVVYRRCHCGVRVRGCAECAGGVLGVAEAPGVTA